MHAAALLICGICSTSALQRVVHFSDDHGNAISDDVVLRAISAGGYTAHVRHQQSYLGQVESTQNIVIATSPLISRLGFTAFAVAQSV
jgi:hypothetical protein